MTRPSEQQRTGRGWAYLGALVGAGASVAANVAHSYVPPAGAAPGWSPHVGAVVGAVFWPVALLVAIEVLAQVGWPTGGRWLVIRFGGLGPVAAVAAVVSYRHLSGLLSFYGEDRITATVGPLAVDGLMVMATGALLATRPTSAEVIEPRTRRRGTTPATTNTSTGTRPVRPDRAKGTLTRGVRPVRMDSAARVAALRAAQPDITTTDIADRLGVSDRTVRRHLAQQLAAEDLTTGREASA
jgi:DNA binding protein with HTH domain